MSLRIAVAAWPIARPAGPAGWLARVGAGVADAAAAGADLVLLPEYAAIEAACGEAPDLDGELARAVTQSPALVEGARDIAARHGVWLLPGSMPFDVEGRIVNRAPLVSPDRRVRFQDKHVMTRFEAESWGVSGGAPPAVFATPWGRIGVAICFDLEFPGLVRAQVEAGAWLILAPSCTDTAHGFGRVRVAAAARAMENQCYVALSPTIGAAPWSAALDANVGEAAVFGPIDRGFAEDGVVAAGGAWVLADLDPARVAAVRADGAVRNHASWPEAPPPCPIL